ncbi:hypothetical protein AOLI_G00139550 [Acnodon oligacanthus]
MTTVRGGGRAEHRNKSFYETVQSKFLGARTGELVMSGGVTAGPPGGSRQARHDSPARSPPPWVTFSSGLPVRLEL